jgi:hypothetical protein
MQRVLSTAGPPRPALAGIVGCLAPHERDLRRLVEARPDVRLAELQADLRQRGIVAGFSTIHNALRRHRKILERGRAGPSRYRRQAAALACLQRQIDLVRFVFLDETGAATNMARPCGRGLSDRRLVDLLSWR